MVTVSQAYYISGGRVYRINDIKVCNNGDKVVKRDGKQYYVCNICGRILFHKNTSQKKIWCTKHYNQFKKYGFALDKNPRTVFDKNEIKVEGDIANVYLYDKNCNHVATAIIDAEDVVKVRNVKWKLSTSGYAMNTPKFKGGNLHMSRIILGTNQFVDHINHNRIDNRKCNLRVVTKSQNQMNVNYKGVSKTKDGKFYAHIKINGEIINLGTYIFEEEALFSRWYAETILFKEYRYPKEKPVILHDRELQIKEYVMRRCRDYNNRRCSTKYGENVRHSPLPNKYQETEGIKVFRK